jgi:hypothetical protein
MYVLRLGRWTTLGSSHTGWRTCTLVEMTAKELARAEQEGKHEYRKVTAREAHRHVREDRVHETPLYIDQGRIRRAG